MFVRRKIPWSWTLYYCWPSLLYFLMVAVLVFLLRQRFPHFEFQIPSGPVTMLATAIAIFLGFKNNEAYARWWEARKIWGLAVNYSRAWARQVLSLVHTKDDEHGELRQFQRRLIYRHVAFIHALRIFLRSTESFPQEDTSREPVSVENDYADCHRLLDDADFAAMIFAHNPPEVLLQRQGQDLQNARQKNWISEYVLVHMDQTLVELNNVQGRAERIKKTPLPRPYSYFQRLFVHILGTLLPFAFVTAVEWLMIPLSFVVSFVFLSLDLIGSRTEDPFENRVDDVPMSGLSRTIERNMRESLCETELPPEQRPNRGILF